jgi:uncharacterized repeat protein (TIGR01451 family)
MAALCGWGLLALTNHPGAALAAADTDLPGAAPNLELVPAGSLVIPMDNTLQALNGKPFNLKSYGLVNALLQSHIPVKWAIATGKAKDGIDFTARAQRLLPTTAAASNLSFRAGPFIVHRDFAALARPVMAAFGGSVAVYELTTNVTVDIRYTLAHKPRLLVLDDGNTQTIHTSILQEAGFGSDHYAIVHAAEAQSYASNSCYTLVTAPHYKPSDLQRTTNEARSIRAFLEAGGNFLAQCASVRTYENNTHFGHFQCSHGLADDNRGSGFTYPNADLAFSQFQGELADISGNLTDWKLAAGASFVNGAHVHVRNTANTNSMAASASKLAAGKVGSVVFYLGGHDYAGDKIANYNGRRMYLNSVFVPARRPADCGFNFGTDLSASMDDGVTTVQPGQQLTYTIVISNGGPSSVVGASVVHVLPAELADVTWTSVVTGDATCSIPAGTGAINQRVDLPTGGAVIFTMRGTVVASTACLLTNRVTVMPPAGIVDTTPGNNTAEDVDHLAAPVRAPGDLTLECADQVPAPVTTLAQFLAQGGVVAGDCCGTPPTVTHLGDTDNGGQGCPASPRVIVRAYRVNYPCRDAALCSQTITLKDTTAPQIVCPPNLLVQRLSRVPAPDPSAVVATDNCGTPSRSFLGDRLTTNGAILTITRTYAATDACGNVATCNQLITVDPSFGAPAALADSYSLNEDTTLTIAAPGVLANDTDPDGDPLAAILVTGPAHGTLSLNPNGSFAYRPPTNFFGTDSFTYRANDGAANSNPVQVSFTVRPVNDPPTLDPVANRSINEDAGTVTIPLTGITSGAANENDPLSVTVVHSNPGLLTGVAIDYTSPNSTGTLRFTTVPDAFGTATITITVNDGGASNNIITRTFTVTVVPVNDPPTLDPIADVNILEDAGPQIIPLTGISSGAANEADTLTITVHNSNPALLTNVTVDYTSPDSIGTLHFNTVSNAIGIAVITITVNDGGASNNLVTQTFTVTVWPDDWPPQLDPIPDLVIDEDAGFQTLGLSGIRTKARYQIQEVTVTRQERGPDLLTGPTVEYLAEAGLGTVTFGTLSNAFGSASFTVTVTDNQPYNNTVSRNFTITVLPVNDPPSFAKGPDQWVNMNAGPQTVANWATAISAGPANEAGQQLTFVVSHDRPALFAGPPAISANGTLTYTPAANAYGVATVTVALKDNGGTANGGVDTSASRTFTLTVNSPPSVSLTKPTNGTVFIAPATITVIADASDPDGSVSEVRLFRGASLMAALPAGPYYTIWTNAPAGQYQFTAQATDNRGAKATSAPVNVTVLSNPPLSVIVAMRFNPQTGLFEQKVRVSNPTPYAYEAVRVWIKNLPAKQTVFNSSGQTNGVPYVQSNLPVPPGTSVDLLIEYYVPDRLPQEPLLLAELVAPNVPSNPKGLPLQVTRSLKLPDGTFLLEFMSVANRTYYVKYSDDLKQWKTALPSITGSGSRVQWIDNGPPRTEPAPGLAPSRYYRVIVLP